MRGDRKPHKRRTASSQQPSVALKDQPFTVEIHTHTHMRTDTRAQTHAHTQKQSCTLSYRDTNEGSLILLSKLGTVEKCASQKSLPSLYWERGERERRTVWNKVRKEADELQGHQRSKASP